MFSVFGLVLTGVGVLHPELCERSLNININLWWGLFMLVFGASMLGLAVANRQK